MGAFIFVLRLGLLGGSRGPGSSVCFCLGVGLALVFPPVCGFRCSSVFLASSLFVVGLGASFLSWSLPPPLARCRDNDDLSDTMRKSMQRHWCSTQCEKSRQDKFVQESLRK